MAGEGGGAGGGWDLDLVIEVEVDDNLIGCAPRIVDALRGGAIGLIDDAALVVFAFLEDEELDGVGVEFFGEGAVGA